MFGNFLKFLSKMSIYRSGFRPIAFKKWTVRDVFLRVRKICFLKLAMLLLWTATSSCCLLSYSNACLI